MGLLDILNSKELGSVLGTILGGAGGQMPGGMQQGGNPYGQYGNAGRGGRDAAPGGLGGLGDLAGLDLGKLTQGGLGGGLGMLLGTLLGAGMGAGARGGAGGMARNVALVGAGLAAWSFFKKWSAQRQQEGAYAGAGAGAGTNPFSADFQASTGDPTAQLVVRSLVYAARADGHIDEAEQVRIVDAMKQLFPGQDLQKLVNSLLREPVDAKALAAPVKSMEEAEDVYMMSCMAIDIDHPAERAYLDELAGSFGMPRDRQAAIEREAAEAKNRMAGAGL